MPEEELIVNQFYLLTDMMKNNGFEHYEISSFSKPGYRSKHNSSYWSGTTYFGFGPSAHSYFKVGSDEECRMWNISNNQLYIKSINEKVIPSNSEILTVNEKLNEYIMTGLRTWKGCDLEFIKDKYGLSYVKSLRKSAKEHLESKKIVEDDGHWFLSNKGKLFADQVIADLFII